MGDWVRDQNEYEVGNDGWIKDEVRLVMEVGLGSAVVVENR